VKTSLLDFNEEGPIWLQPRVVLDTIENQLFQHMISEVLFHWKDMPPKDETWEPTKILQLFSHIQP